MKSIDEIVDEVGVETGAFWLRELCELSPDIDTVSYFNGRYQK